MNSLKLLRAQYTLGLTLIDERLKLGIENYVSALEARITELEEKQPEACPCGGTHTSLGKCTKCGLRFSIK